MRSSIRIVAAVATVAVAVVGCDRKPSPSSDMPAARPAETAAAHAASTTGCQASLPTASVDAQLETVPGLKDIVLVDPTPALWGLQLPDGAPLAFDGSVEVPPLHVNVRHRFDPRLSASAPGDLLIYLIFPKNDFTVKPAAGWHHEPGSTVTVVYCRDLREARAATKTPDDYFWLTPMDARTYAVQWQVVSQSPSGLVASRIHGLAVKVTP